MGFFAYSSDKIFNENNKTNETDDASYVATTRSGRVLQITKPLIEEVKASAVNQYFGLTQAEINYYVLLEKKNENKFEQN